MGMDRSVTGGGKVGTRILELVTRGIVSTHGDLQGIKRNLGAAVLEDFFDKVSGEVRHTAGPILAPIADHEHTPEQMRPLFRFLATGNGQWQSILGQSVVGTAVGTGLGTLLTNTLQPVVGRIVAAQPNLPLGVADAARAQATGFTGSWNMEFEAAQQGVDPDKFRLLVELSRPRLAPEQVNDLLNRSEVNADYARTLLREAGFSDSDIGLVLELRRSLIDPARLADLVTFGVLSQNQAAPKAAEAGMIGEDFDLLVQGNGQPPSTQELLFAYRRGIIDKARLLRGITQGPLRNEWFDVVESFGQVPMSTADAIHAYITGHLSETEARAIAVQNGLIPSQFDPLFQSAGSPPGPQEMLHLLNRGEMTEAEVIQGLRESRLNNKYIQKILASRYQLPTEPQILSMMRKGVITEARGRQLLEWRGYPPDIIDALTSEATAAAPASAKELSLTTVRELYLDKAITSQQATDRIKALGFGDADAALELQLIDEQRDRRYVNAVITRIHREYVMGLLTIEEAQQFLGQLHVPADQVATNMALWDVEKATVRRGLTEAQVAQAYKRNLITAEDAMARWQVMGYSASDANLLLAINTPATPTNAG